jgi:hypothetical protein
MPFAVIFLAIEAESILFRRKTQRRYLPTKRIIQLRRINDTIIMVGIKYSFVRNSRQNITQMIRQLIIFRAYEFLKNTQSIRHLQLLRVDLCQNSQIFHAQNTKSPPNIYKDLGEPPRCARFAWLRAVGLFGVRYSLIPAPLRGLVRASRAPTIPLAA